MGPSHGLPLPKDYQDDEKYINDLIDFIVSSDLLQLLCGGVHILDFFTREPDLYECLLPVEWRDFFELHDLTDILDLFLREDVKEITTGTGTLWRGQSLPPASLSNYISKIRSLALQRDFNQECTSNFSEKNAKEHSSGTIPRHIAVGMKEKKIHEVDHFTRYVNNLIAEVEHRTCRKITHLVDFGSGQNYLGRTLASPPYNKHVIAVESRHANVEGAKAMDVHAKLATKTVVWRNKKAWRAQLAMENTKSESNASSSKEEDIDEQRMATHSHALVEEAGKVSVDINPARAVSSQTNAEGGSIKYIEHRLEDGNLESIIEEALKDNARTNNEGAAVSRHNEPNLMVMSLHSCGNLTHHGLRSLVLNPSVSAVALVGCCYNLVTERFTAPTYKLPNLKPQATPLRDAEHEKSSSLPEIERNSNSKESTPKQPPEQGDPHGFPMSALIKATNINLNITARMMAVQAPYNWSETDSERFFTRHFYRALLQKIFLDKGVVEPPSSSDATTMLHTDRAALLREISAGDKSNAVRIPGGATQPVIIGSLRKACYNDFRAYVRGAVFKLSNASSSSVVSVDESATGNRNEDAPASIAELVRSRMSPEQITDEEIDEYEARFAHRRKHLSVVWSLMAFSATLVEALIVVDRWLWLREQMGDGAEVAALQDSVEEASKHRKVKWAWVRSVFDYSWSPRNLAIVGIKE